MWFTVIILVLIVLGTMGASSEDGQEVPFVGKLIGFIAGLILLGMFFRGCLGCGV